VAWMDDLGIYKPHLRAGSSIQWHETMIWGFANPIYARRARFGHMEVNVRLCISLVHLGLTILRNSVDLQITFVCLELHSVVWTNNLGIPKPHLHAGSSIP
jgi:hypothetical protein